MKNQPIFLMFALLVVGGTLLSEGCVSSTPHSESTGQYIDNSALTLKVKTRLLADDSIRSFPITVNSYKNTVQLSGFVNNAYQRDRAAAIAASVKGVKAVKNDLIIRAHLQ